jgi:hypothetical protein
MPAVAAPTLEKSCHAYLLQTFPDSPGQFVKYSILFPDDVKAMQEFVKAVCDTL